MKKPGNKKMITGIILFVSHMMLASCQKPKEEKNCEISEVTIGGAYILEAMTYKINSVAPAQNWLNLLDECEKDDIIYLCSNGVYEYFDMGLTCDPKGDAIGTWSLRGRELSSDGLVNGTIEKFDCKTLVFYLNDGNVPGDRVTITLLKG